ncbi:hypothetical protein LTR15_000355 [Elasticomyces elasticus]|nr:hypothetical protein LTR15_000355 [Elasticomyces elasticus]
MTEKLAQEYLDRAYEAERTILQLTTTADRLCKGIKVIISDAMAAKASYFDVIAGMQKELAEVREKVIDEQCKVIEERAKAVEESIKVSELEYTVAELEKTIESMEEKKKSDDKALQIASATATNHRARIVGLEDQLNKVRCFGRPQRQESARLL